VITDIHGNLPALQASLDAIEAIGVDQVCCGGDLVGYGPHPNEVCALIEERAIPTIYGNYDYAIARDLDDCGCAYVTQHDRELGQRSVQWTLAHTDRRAKDFMQALPFDLRFELGGRGIHLVHGSPRKVNEYLFEEKPARLYERLAAAEADDVLVFGHTHKPWIHEYGGVLFVNCGSVGKPKDGDPRCAFAVLELDQDGRVQASIERVHTTPRLSPARSRRSTRWCHSSMRASAGFGGAMRSLTRRPRSAGASWERSWRT
jgi:putative phosphoesterase